MSIRSRLAGLVILAIVIGVLSWFLRNTSSNQAKITNVLLISIDTCRADHLSCYGYPKATTPNIDALAQRGVLFKNAFSPVPLTLPAHSSMLTGTVPPYHGTHLNFDQRLDASIPTLATILKGEGFATGAVISAFVLDGRFGLNQGFDSYQDRYDVPPLGGRGRPGHEANRYAIDWLTLNSQAPFFMFLHYYDPHDPYEPPEPFASQYPDDPYTGEIAYTDHCIGQVVSKLKELGLFESTLIVVTGDHGEMLGEHGELTHGYFIYDSAIHVPLIFKLPGDGHTGTFDERVGLIDIVPTICGLLGIEPNATLQGIDLSDCVLNGTNPPQSRDLYCESLTPTNCEANSLLGVVTDRWKYIQTTLPELYDLASDPGETNNLASTEVQLALDMQSLLAEILESQLREDADSKLALDAQSRKRLESLGYVGGGSTEGAFKFDVSKDDPKGLIQFHNDVVEFNRITNEKDYDEANRMGEELLRQRPNFTYGYRQLGYIAMEQGNYKRAIPYLRRAIKMQPDDWEIFQQLGLALFYENQLDESLIHLRHALEMFPDDASTHHMLGMTLRWLYKNNEAIQHFRRALELNPDFPGAHGNLANALLSQGNAEEAIAHYRQALQQQPDFTEARYMLGVALGGQGKTEEAIQCYHQVLEAKPDDAQAHSSLGVALSTIGQLDEAVDHLRRAIQIDPNHVAAHHKLGQILAVTSRPAEAVKAFRKVVQLKPDRPIPINDLAWILATCPDDAVRSADEAVKLAERACDLTDRKEAGLLDTLAAAYAEAGQFDKAISTIQTAIALAQESRATELAEGLKTRLALYQQNKPYRESMSTGN